LIVSEEKLEGDVGLKDYINLYSFSLGIFSIILYVFVAVICALLQLAPSYLIAAWTGLPQDSND